MACESVKISIRIPKDYADWLERQVNAKREQGFRSSITDEIMTCVVHRYLALLPSAKRKNVLAAMASVGPKSSVGQKPSEEQTELIGVDLSDSGG